MSLMIKVTEESSGVLVKVDGWLEAAGVDELESVLRSTPKPVRLMLHDLRGADSRGLSLLRELETGDTPLEGLSAYLKLVLAGRHDAVPRHTARIVGSDTPVRREDT